MKVICVILCLIISTTTAYANTVLWSKAHSSTNLIKDEGWIEEQISAEALFVSTMELEMPVTTVEGIEDITGLAPDDEGIEIIDSMIVEEWSKWSEEPTADTPEAPAVEDMVTTPDEASAQEEGLNELVEDHIETGDTIPE